MKGEPLCWQQEQQHKAAAQEREVYRVRDTRSKTALEVLYRLKGMRSRHQDCDWGEEVLQDTDGSAPVF